MFSKFFVDRPIFATVVSLIFVLAGLVSMKVLPVEQYPNIVPTEIQISAVYPGATAEVLADTVAAPIEQEINGVKNMIYMYSSATSQGYLTIGVVFEIGTDPDQATIDVNNKVQMAMSKLPAEVTKQGVTVEQKSNSILQVVMMKSDSERYDTIYVSNYALLNVLDEVRRIKGVGSATLFASQDYSMRIMLSPDKLADYDMTPEDVIAAVQEQNSQFAAGQFGQEPLDEYLPYTYSVNTKGRLVDEKEFGDIILKSDADGGILRLRDVARIELGAQDYSVNAYYNGDKAVAFAIYLQPGANALETANLVKAKLAELSKDFPEGISYAIPYDTTLFVNVSIEEVIHTFFEAVLLVIVVVYLFLQNMRATLIPVLAVPVSIVGAFAGIVVTTSLADAIPFGPMRLAIAMVVGALCAAVAGVIVGIPVLRLKGDYLAIVTLAFGEIIKNIINVLYIGLDEKGLHFSLLNQAFELSENGKMIINGPMGVSGVTKLSSFTAGFVLILITLFLVLNLIHSRTGRAVMAVRDNRIAAESIGIPVTRYRLLAFVISAALAGAAGTLYAMNFSTVTATKFDFNTSILILVFVVLGGLGNIWGSIIAAALLTVLPELLRSMNDYRMLIYAILLIAMMIFNNSGLKKRLLEKRAAARAEKAEAKHGKEAA